MCNFELDEFKIGDRVKVIKNSGRDSRVSMIGEKGTCGYHGHNRIA